MPLNKKNRPVRRKSIRHLKSPRCSCNCDSNHNGEKSHAAKSPVGASKLKTVYKQKEVRTEKAVNNNFTEKSLSEKDQSSLSKETEKNKKRYTGKEKKSKLQLAQHPTSKDRTVTASSLELQTNNSQPSAKKCSVVIIVDGRKPEESKITQLGLKHDTKTTHSLKKSQSQQSIKQCWVLLTPLPQKVLKQKQMKKTEVRNKTKPTVKMNMLKSIKRSPRRPCKESIAKVDGGAANQTNSLRNKPKPTVKMKNMLKSEKSLIRPCEESIAKANGGAVNQINALENNTQINSQTSSNEIKENPKYYIENKEDKAIKKPLIDRTNLNKPLPMQKLRKRKCINYAESSLEISREIQKNVNTNKIPVYKQQTENVMKLKGQEDTYEFDSDSEQRKKRKKRKLNNSSSDEYNKTIENILKNVGARIKRKKKNVFPSYKNHNNDKVFKCMKPLIVPAKKENVAQNKPIINVTFELKNNEVEKHITSEMAVKTHQPEEVPAENVEIQDYSDGDDNEVDFGFDDAEANKENSPKIKIISNIRLLPNEELTFNVETPSKFREVRPSAHSTMLNTVLTPWRFNDVNIMRNPHFITLKESSLPCINQDMVLDHTMVDKFADTSKTESAKTPLRMNDENMQNHKKMIQSLVSDFFEGNTEHKENENTQLSLFDNDHFSPIKNLQFGSKADSVKRRILGELNDNTKKVYVSTPKQNASNLRIPELVVTNKDSANFHPSSNVENSQKKKSNREFTNFGFTSSDEENDNQNSPNKNRDNKPFRLNVSANDKKYPVKQKLKKPEKTQPVILSDAESEMCELSDAESHSGEVKLFEDFADTDNDDRFLEPKIKKKKKKLKWMDNHNMDTQKHRRRKDIRTKEEEAEAEKWAADFNSMCQEIEKFPLEIE